VNQATWNRLFGWREAFEEPFVLWSTVGVVIVLVLSGLIIQVLYRKKAVGQKTYEELFLRWRSWLVLTVFMIVPILLGAAWTILAVMLLSLAVFSEYSRATGLFRDKLVSAVVVLCIFALSLAAFDHWERLYFALAPFSLGLIVVSGLIADRPDGYIQRVALGSLGFLMFGYSLGYLGLISNDPNYRPILFFIFITVELNDVFAYCVGRLFGRHKLAPVTSPAKTIEGAYGAIFLTTCLAIVLGKIVFRGTAVDDIQFLIGLGLVISVLGHLGDLVISSIKRDVGIKDIGGILPGMGGLLDRFDSMVLVLPVVYHSMALVMGEENWLGSAEVIRIFTGGAG
jgi:phosphatidate cytidylyltransferase